MGTLKGLARTLIPPLACALATASLPTAAAAAAPTTPSSPTISVDRPCYVNGTSNAQMMIKGAGWTPGDTVHISGAEEPVSATVASDGTFTVSGLAPSGNFGLRQESEQLAASETDGTTGQPVSGAAADASFLVTDLAFSVNPQDASMTRKVTFRFSGFLPGRAIYAHYLHGKRVVARQRLGHAGGPCGLLKARALQYPGGHPGFRHYTVQFDDSSHYSRHSLPRIVTPLRVIRD